MNKNKDSLNKGGAKKSKSASRKKDALEKDQQADKDQQIVKDEDIQENNKNGLANKTDAFKKIEDEYDHLFFEKDPQVKALEEIWEEAYEVINSFKKVGHLSPEEQVKILKDRAESLRTSVEEAQSGESVEFVVFELSDDWYALEVNNVEEVINLSEITPVPCTPEFTLGIIYERGQIHSVIDVRSLFGSEDKVYAKDAKLILTKEKCLQTCLYVDSILQKQKVNRESIKAPETEAKDIKKDFIDGFVKIDDKLVSIINWENLVSKANLVVHEEI